MKSCFFVLTLFFFSLNAASQSKKNIQLLDNWQDNTLIANSSKVRYSDCWGIELNNTEYALLSSTEGTHAFEISNDGKLIELDFVEGLFPSTMVIHRDIKTYLHYAYTVCDEGESSLQIIDLQYLPDSLHLVNQNDSTFARVHNLFIDEENALMYACLITPKTNGVLSSQKSMQVFSLADPENPILVFDGPTDIPEVHDVYVRDNIAILNCGFDGLRVYDFTNPSSPVFKQNLTLYQDQGYNHQGWLSPDGKTYVFGDETGGKRLKKCSVNENNEIEIENLFGTNYENNSVPHNIMITNEFAFIAYYNEGLRIFDLRPRIPVEIAHYDTFPQDSFFNMEGAWGVYTKLRSNRILISDRRNGLFVFDFNQKIFQSKPSIFLEIYPNPSLINSNITTKISTDIGPFKIQLFDLLGKKIGSYSSEDFSYITFPSPNSKGIYTALISYENYLGEVITISEKLIVN